MKKILITQRLVVDEKSQETRECLDIRWSSYLKELGFLPLAMSYNIEVENYLNDPSIAGVILSGGNDLSVVSPEPINKTRDAYENQILLQSAEKKLPLIGVCRGMQVISNFTGVAPENISDHVSSTHEVIIKKPSKYFRHYPDKVDVNSFHNYGIQRITSDLSVTALSEDGSIEAFEHKSLPWVGIMWHPEREDPFSDYDKKLFLDLFGQRK